MVQTHLLAPYLTHSPLFAHFRNAGTTGPLFRQNSEFSFEKVPDAKYVTIYKLPMTTPTATLSTTIDRYYFKLLVSAL